MNWISVEDRLPPIDTWVLVYFENDYDCFHQRKFSVHKMYERLTGDWETEEQKKDRFRWTCVGTASHWMPLPEKP